MSRPVFFEGDSAYPPFRAGKDNGLCTTAFTVSNAFGHFGTSAGHCAELNDNVAMGGTAYSFVSADHLNPGGAPTPTRADVLAFPIPDTNDARTVSTANGIKRRVWALTPDVDLAGNASICKKGMDTGVTCGTIQPGYVNLSMRPTPGHDPLVEHVWCSANTTMDHGDSGGPIYQTFGR
jgi:hypothetical protein